MSQEQASSFALTLARTPRARRPALSFASPDIALALLVVAVVGMMIVPLPTWLLDVLIATNLSAAVTILLVVLYVPDALAIATFPTILLLTTLFRLALNVSSTRLILLQANAGEVIRAFGNFVVRGNYVVGGVIFLILTVIQFVVIAKGSERVAEVGARFVLDAMPGKQMAIDAELRSGAIDAAEARRRRRSLARESQFYGSMDGAMKFVKGDVIASIVITVVNVLGGLTIGVLQRDMAPVDALKRYGLLTIGDGLVSQIPALVLSTAAGVLVTRVASEEAETPLGAELSSQLLASPRALTAAAGFVALLAALPGLPAAPFVLLAAVLWLGSRAAEARRERKRKDALLGPAAGAKADARFVPVVVPWSVDVASDLEALIDDAVDASGAPRPGLETSLERTRAAIFAELGVPLPRPRLRVSASLPAGHVAVSLHEVPEILVAVDARGVAVVTDACAALLRRRAADFLGLSETQRLLDELEGVHPATVRAVVPKPVPLTLLADVLRRLVEEGVSIRDLRAVLEGLAVVAANEKDALQLTEFVRGQLRRATTFRLTGGGAALDVVTLDPSLEDVVRRAITRTPAGAFLALPPAASRDVIASLRRAATEAKAASTRGACVVLTQPDTRRFVRKLIEADLPDAVVVSFADVLPEVSLRPVARAHLAGLG